MVDTVALKLRGNVKTLSFPLLLLLLLAPLAARAEPGILLFPSIGQPSALTVAGRVLKDLPTSGSSPLSQNLRRLTEASWEGAELEVAFLDHHAKVKSGRGGAFEVTFKPPPGQSFPVGKHPVEARASWGRGRAGVEIISPEAPFVVISDFDDTVAVSNVIHVRQMMKAALMEDADTLPPVPGMADFYACLLEGKAQEPGLAVVSGSPWQYVPRTGAFLAKNRFPFAGLYLRDLGPKTLSNYKQPIIRLLMARLPNKFILVGDSGEQDPEVYAQIRKEFPERVADIYIRKVRDTEPASRFPGMTVFTQPRQAAEHARGKGYLSEACLESAFGKGEAGK